MIQIINTSSVKTISDVCGTIKELYSSENISFSIAEISGTSTPHKHKQMEEIYFVLSGTGIIYIGDDLLPIKPGDLIPIPKDILHHIKTNQNEVLELVVITHPKFDKSDVIEQ